MIQTNQRFLVFKIYIRKVKLIDNDEIIIKKQVLKFILTCSQICIRLVFANIFKNLLKI